MKRDDPLIFNTLKRHGVPFVIVGGHAVNFHGRIRNTEDVDVVWLRTPASEQALLSALAELNAGYIGSEIDPATGIEKIYPVTLTSIRADHLMMLWTDYGFLDLFDYIPSDKLQPVQPLFDSAVSDGQHKFASYGWTIRMKQASGRSKDIEDLENIPKPNNPIED